MKKESSAKLKVWQWRILLAFASLYFFYYFGRENISFAIPLLKEEHGWSSAQLGTISSGLFWVYAAGQLLWGKLSDRVGGRLLCAVGGLASTALNWICSFATSTLSLAIPWTANGLAQSMGWAPGNRLIANWWSEERRGYALGIVLSFTGGAIIAIWSLSGWIGKYYSWREIFRLPVLILGAISVVYFFLVRDFSYQTGLPESEKETGESKSSYLSLLKNYEFDLACVSAGMANFARYFFTIWTPLYYYEVTRLSLEKVALMCLALPVGMSLGPFMGGWVSDRAFGGKRYIVVVIFLSVSAMLTFMLGVLSGRINLVVNTIILFAIGFLVYGLQGPMYALSAEIAGKNQVGTAAGIMDSASYIIGALQGITVGWLLTASAENWQLVFTVVAVIQLIGARIAWRIKR